MTLRTVLSVLSAPCQRLALLVAVAASEACLCLSASAMGRAGSEAYQFLRQPVSSAAMMLGGDNVSNPDADACMLLSNPALASVRPSQSVALHFSQLPGGGGRGAAGWVCMPDSNTWVGIGVQFVGYGSMDAYNDDDTPDGSVSASEAAMAFTYVRRLASWLNAGLQFKPIFSSLAGYNSVGLAADVGAMVHLDEHFFTAGLAVRNAGAQLKPYEDGRQDLPLDVQLGLTKKLAHAPFRFSITATMLNKWDLDYFKDDNLYKSTQTSSADYDSDISWGDMLMRHLIIGAEFVPSKNFCVGASYNHRRHQEMTLNEGGSGAGWSFGARLQVSRFGIGAAYQILGAEGNNFGVSLSSLLGR